MWSLCGCGDAVNKYNRIWLRRVWSHYREQRNQPTWQRTYFWHCVRASIALILNRNDVRIIEDWRLFSEKNEVAWNNLGTYWTDYGTGYAWEALHCRGLSFAVIEDSNL